MYPMLFFNLPIEKDERFMKIEQEVIDKGFVEKKFPKVEEGKEIKDPLTLKRAILYQEVERQLYCDEIIKQEELEKEIERKKQL